jgi:GGDEF domain-containing protein
MAKERTEFRHRTAAMVDALTGVANRRAFLQDASLLAKRQERRLNRVKYLPSHRT